MAQSLISHLSVQPQIATPGYRMESLVTETKVRRQVQALNTELTFSYIRLCFLTIHRSCSERMSNAERVWIGELYQFLQKSMGSSFI